MSAGGPQVQASLDRFLNPGAETLDEARETLLQLKRDMKDVWTLAEGVVSATDWDVEAAAYVPTITAEQAQKDAENIAGIAEEWMA